MKETLPFTALRSFEAVARLRGFGRAAEELGVTQSAVSQSIKSLEEWLGCRILFRNGSGVGPTEQGARLAEAVEAGFGSIAAICAELREEVQGSRTITLSCPPGFAFNWLFPRLINFDEAHPEYPVSIVTALQPTDFVNDEVDLMIGYGPGAYPRLHAEKLLAEQVFPVCSPSLIASGPPLATPADLAHHTLLIDEVAASGGTPPSWEYWATTSGVSLPRFPRSRRFGQANLAVQAAINGLGVALGREPLVIDALADGRLVRPFGDAVPSQYAYWIVCPAAFLTIPRIRSLRDWLREEAARQPLLPDALVVTRT